ncbi:MAG TPA: MBL fold metallo-hydrolase RNA specificity domain-containing protein, partial [Sphingobacteriaceae bacterium]
YHNIQNYYCTILFIGYCAKGTLGHRLLRGDHAVTIRNRELSVYATIKQTDLLSGHGDHNDLMDFIKTHEPAQLKRVFLVHGERQAMDALVTALQPDGYDVVIPEAGQVFELN